MEVEVVDHPAVVQRLVMPHRLDRRVPIKLENHICSLFYREDVPHAHIRQIKDDPHLFDIWRTLPHDMRTLMRHFFGVLTLILRLRDHAQSWSSLRDEVPGDALHDFPLSHASEE